MYIGPYLSLIYTVMDVRPKILIRSYLKCPINKRSFIVDLCYIISKIKVIRIIFHLREFHLHNKTFSFHISFVINIFHVPHSYVHGILFLTLLKYYHQTPPNAQFCILPSTKLNIRAYILYKSGVVGCILILSCRV